MTENKFNVGENVVYKNKIRTIKAIRKKNDLFFYEIKGLTKRVYIIEEKDIKLYAEITRTENKQKDKNLIPTL